MFTRVSKHNQIQFRLHCTDSLLLLNIATLNVTLGTESVITHIIFLLFDIYKQCSRSGMFCKVLIQSQQPVSFFFEKKNSIENLLQCREPVCIIRVCIKLTTQNCAWLEKWQKSLSLLISSVNPNRFTPFLLSLASRLTYAPLDTADIRVQFLNC